MTETLGRCAKCRVKTLVELCKVEAFADERYPVTAKLCAPCRTGIKAPARATVIADDAPAEPLVIVPGAGVY